MRPVHMVFHSNAAAGESHRSRAAGTEVPPTAVSLRPVLAGLQPIIPAGMLSGPGLDRVLSVADRLPAVAAGYMGFELRLDRPDPAADLCAAFYPGGPLAGWLSSSGRGARPGTPPAALGGFADRYTRREAAWARASRLAILEYDAADDPPADGLPGVFLIFARPLPIRGRAAPGVAAAAAGGLPGALGLPALPAVRPRVEGVLSAFGDSALVSNVGVFPARSRDSVRLVFAGLNPSSVPGMLLAAGWPGPSGEITRALGDFGGLVRSLGLSLDVDASGVGPRAGLELFAGPPDGWAEDSPSDWTPLLDRLEALGLCLPAKADALRGWTGRSRVFTSWGVRVACRGVNHVKITFGVGAPSVKAYVGLALLDPAGGGPAGPGVPASGGAPAAGPPPARRPAPPPGGSSPPAVRRRDGSVTCSAARGGAGISDGC